MPATDTVSVHEVNHGSLEVSIPKQFAAQMGLRKKAKLRAKVDAEGRLVYKVISIPE